MKKTKILKIFPDLSHDSVVNNGYVIIPHSPLSLSASKKNIDFLKTMLTDLLLTPKQILKLKEQDLLSISKKWDLEVKRDFNILAGDTLINISNFDNCHIGLNNNDIEKTNVDKYLKDYANKIKNYSDKFKFSYLIFNYNIKKVNVKTNQ